MSLAAASRAGVMAAAPGLPELGERSLEAGAGLAASEVASSALRSLAGLAGQVSAGPAKGGLVRSRPSRGLAPPVLSPLVRHLCFSLSVGLFGGGLKVWGEKESAPLLEKLQPLIKEESVGHVEPAGKTEDQSCETSSNVYDSNSQAEEKYANYDLGDPKDAHTNFDPEVVQIKAGKAEIDRRISAFIKRKQAEINENNVREFCNVIDCNQGNWLARL
ncbi:hypothetical protein CIB84_008934 [Bambusicola thoracicus]|uniref:Uncharacterized protein n=1 Tax=Bambusicola thoracicus TaxID=9083 RepID=A0A2P4ST77_BAMTH|nr:hypothetical protein CIB84_008934 [Bambusicola thoracicus]